MSKLIIRRRRTTRPAEAAPADLSSWGTAALHALAQACAMGMILPPSGYYPNREREPRR